MVDASCCNKIIGNGGGGIYIDGSELDLVGINENNIEDNTGDGLLNDSGEVIDAEDNWWGDDSGPGGVGQGSGDTVSDDADYDPWLGLPCDGTPPPPTPPPAVGGEAYPVSKVAILAPWLGLSMLLTGGIIWFTFRRRRAYR